MRLHLLAILLTSLLFAAIHQPWTITPAIFILALALGLSYERTGNILTSITLHICFNAFNILLYLATRA